MPLVEQILPERFGGNATDYQLVEVEDGGMPFVEIVVIPASDQSKSPPSQAPSTTGCEHGQASNSWPISGTMPTPSGW